MKEQTNLLEKTDAQLFGVAEGNLLNLLKYAELPDYQKESLKTVLRAVRQLDYQRIQNNF